MKGKIYNIYMITTRNFFNTNFIIKNKISFTTCVILQDILIWIFSVNPPKNIIVNNVKYHYISQTHMSNINAGLLSVSRIKSIFTELKKIGIIKNSVLVNYTQNYISFNWSKIKEFLLVENELNKIENNEWWKKVHKYANEELARESLPSNSEYEIITKNNKNYLVLKGQETKTNSYNNNMELFETKKDYCDSSNKIASKILTQYSQYFKNKLPKNKPTKTYISICRKIEDIYNGKFLNSRYYKFDEGVFNNKQFFTDGWKEKIKAVKGNWQLVEKLIFDAVKNFILMHEDNRVPFDKKFLTNSLDEWFFSAGVKTKGQSQFIQSLNEPLIQKQKLGMEKAIKLVNKIKQKSLIAYEFAHQLNSLLAENANEWLAWTNIVKIINWGNLLFKYDKNSKYFLFRELNGKVYSGGKVLTSLFADYLVKNKISVNLNTLDIENSVKNNAPWKWFIEDACRQYNIDMKYIYCFNEVDFNEA